MRRRPRHRLPGQEVVVDPGGQVAAPDRPLAQHDPKMDPFAEMALGIGTNFIQSYSVIPAIYDRATHRYRPEYVNGVLNLHLDAKPGLRRARSQRGSHVPLRAVVDAGEVHPRSVGQFLDHWNGLSVVARKMIDGGMGPGQLPDDLPTQPTQPSLDPPKDLLGYDWLISRSGSSWSRNLYISNPKLRDTHTSVALDGPGEYTVRMRVFFTGYRFAEKTVTFSVQHKLVVGLGDSFASGEGNPDLEGFVSNANPLGGPLCSATTASFASGRKPHMERSPVWLEEKAHRSFQSGQAMAARSLQDVYGETWNETAGPVANSFSFTKITFISFARSGGTIRGSLLAPQGGSLNDFVGAGQIEECRRTVAGRPIDALLISIGGNDAGFAGVLTDLVKGDSFYTLTAGLAGTDRDEVRKRLNNLLGIDLPPNQKGGIEVDLETLAGAIENLRRDVPVKDIYINGYPTDLFYTQAADGRLEFRACDIFSTQLGTLAIDINEASLIRMRALG